MPAMRYSAVLFLGLTLTALNPGSALEAQVPTSAEVAAEREWLFEALRTAPTEEIGAAIADQIWRFWFRQGPDNEANQIMAKAMERRDSHDFAGAIEHLDELVAVAPNWAEAWNQRATVLFFQEYYDRSLEDVEKVLALEPKHFGALAGKAVILMHQGRVELGQKALREAVAVHPWLKERGMLLPVPGQEL